MVVQYCPCEWNGEYIEFLKHIPSHNFARWSLSDFVYKQSLFCICVRAFAFAYAMSLFLPYMCSLCKRRLAQPGHLLKCTHPAYRICTSCTECLTACDSWCEKTAVVDEEFAEHGNMQFECSVCNVDLDQPGTPLPSNDPDFLTCHPCHLNFQMCDSIEEKRALVNKAHAARCAK